MNAGDPYISNKAADPLSQNNYTAAPICKIYVHLKFTKCPLTRSFVVDLHDTNRTIRSVLLRSFLDKW